MTIEHGGPAGYEIFYEPRAARDLDALPNQDFVRIDRLICSLNQDPRPNGCVQLSRRTYRVRSGDWRILFLVDDLKRCVVISRVKRRNERTYAK